MPKLSIIVPAFNEERTIETVLSRLVNLPLDKEIIVVDDGSGDLTGAKVKNFDSAGVRLLSHEKNLGKGAALRTGLNQAQGDYIIFCDADLEYDVAQIPILFEHIIQNGHLVVYGSRFIDYQPAKNRLHYFGNRFLTWLTNFLFEARLTDMETAFKMFRADVLRSLKLSANHFEIEPEITAQLLKQGVVIAELPVSYDPRVKKEGKKIKYRDGWIALKILLKEKFKRG